MNTKPDDELLALWVEDELDAETAARVDAWASLQPEWVERREQARWSRELLGRTLGGPAEVPHAEFFNARIRREIELAAPAAGGAPAPGKVRRGPWLWLMPATAAAGMALGFLLGHGGDRGTAAPPVAAELAPVLYTPEKGVEVEYVGGEEATVIVLAGVQAIPDEWEVPETAMVEPEPSRMASHGDDDGEGEVR